MVLYETQVWDLGYKKTGWEHVMRVQKIFLQEELGVRNQTSYASLIAEHVIELK